jgi:RNA polymerase sigma factor (sigma-70 family)
VSALRPEEVTAILRSATTAQPDPRLEVVLQSFRREWEAIATARYSRLGADRDDVMQQALLKLVSPDKLARLGNPAVVRAWGRSIFVNTALDALRERYVELRHRTWLADGEADPETVLRERIPSRQPGPEETARDRERLALALRVVEEAELGRLRFVDGVREKDLARRFGLSRDAVAGQLKRLRRRIRQLLGEHE